MRLVKLILIIDVIFGARAGFSQNAPGPGVSAPPKQQKTGKPFYTYPYPLPAHRRPRLPLAVFPSVEIPINPEKYTWRITGKDSHGKVIHPDSVPIYSLDTGRRSIVGQLPVGTEVKLTLVTHYRHLLYYAVPFSGTGSPPQTRSPSENNQAWISGESIEAVAITPADQ